MRWLKLPLDVIWKHQMGARYWTWGNLIGHTFVLQFVPLFIGASINSQEKVATSLSTFRETIAGITVEIFVVLIWIFGVANLLEIRQQRRSNSEWYSHYWGKPRFLPDTPLTHCLLIPIGSALIAMAILWPCPPLAWYLYLLACIQMFDAVEVFQSRRKRQLDQRDRAIQMEWRVNEDERARAPELDIVRIAKPMRRTRTSEQEALFETRWQKVLKEVSKSSLNKPPKI